jgi:hypothetical protein
VYTAADIEELLARLIATTDPAAAHQLHELDSALAQLREQQPMDEVWLQQALPKATVISARALAP